MAGQFPPPKVFADWLKLITEAKAGWGYSDYAESWLNGARMLVRTGTTTVADIEAVPQLLPKVWRATPLRVFSFLEMIGIRGQRQPAGHCSGSRGANRCAQALPRSPRALSPHAPYSTVPELLRLSAQTARRRKWRLTTHLAESALEFEMFARGRGAMFDWLRAQRARHVGLRPGLARPAPGALRRAEREPAGRARELPRDGGMRPCWPSAGCTSSIVRAAISISTTIRSPCAGWRRAGVNVCLGTDSLASVYKARRQTVELSLFEEMRALAKNEPSLSARRIVRMATRQRRSRPGSGRADWRAFRGGAGRPDRPPIRRES